jgi:hypothetical protein
VYDEHLRKEEKKKTKQYVNKKKGNGNEEDIINL